MTWSDPEKWGMVQYTLGALAGVFVGIFHDGSALPMVLTMTGCALAGSLAFLLATTEAGRSALQSDCG